MTLRSTWHTSAAFRYGISVFEGIRADRNEAGGIVLMGGVPHLRRLRASLRGLGMPARTPDASHLAEITEVIRQPAPACPFGVRIFAYISSAGILSDEVDYVYDAVDLSGYGSPHPPNLLMGDFRKHAEGGLPPSIKSPSAYTTVRRALLAAHEQGADDVLFLNEWGRVTEATRSSAIFVSDGRCLVPPLCEGVLNGITRRTVSILARHLGFEWVEEEIPPEEATRSTSILLASSSLGLRPAGSLNGRELPVCPTAEQLLRAYRELATELGTEAGNIELSLGAR